MNLFERCGEQDLRFVVNSGLVLGMSRAHSWNLARENCYGYGCVSAYLCDLRASNKGGLLGVGQMLLWIVWSPWWSLALTGAAVGLVTDQLALKLIFEPVEPKRIGPLVMQGLFLKRQDEVGREFAAFMADYVLTPAKLWNELLQGSRSSSFWRLLSLRVDSALGVAPDAGLPNFAGQGCVSDVAFALDCIGYFRKLHKTGIQ